MAAFGLRSCLSGRPLSGPDQSIEREVEAPAPVRGSGTSPVTDDRRTFREVPFRRRASGIDPVERYQLAAVPPAFDHGGIKPVLIEVGMVEQDHLKRGRDLAGDLGDQRE